MLSLTLIQLENSSHIVAAQTVIDVHCKDVPLRVFDAIGNEIDQIVVGNNVTLKQGFYYELFGKNGSIPISEVNATIDLLDRDNHVITSWNKTSKLDGIFTEFAVNWTPSHAGILILRTNIEHCGTGAELNVVSYPHPLNVSDFGAGQKTPFSPPIGAIYAGYPVSIQQNVQNRQAQDTKFSAIIQVVDENGFTVLVNATDYNLASKGTINVNTGWNATMAGNYTISILVVSDLNTPTVLAEPQSREIPFVQFCCVSPYPTISPQ